MFAVYISDREGVAVSLLAIQSQATVEEAAHNEGFARVFPPHCVRSSFIEAVRVGVRLDGERWSIHKTEGRGKRTQLPTSIYHLFRNTTAMPEEEHTL